MNEPTKTRLSLRVSMFLVLAAAAFLLFELGSFVGLKFFVYPRDSGAFYDVPEIDRERYQSYLQHRHPVLGWPFVMAPDGTPRDPFEARPVASFSAQSDECVVTVGDSFTYGDEVEHEEAWSSVLSDRLGCRVANFGVGGYGTDQALIRFLEVPAEDAQLAILGIFPHNAMRNVNQYRYFLTGSNAFGFKPRFTLIGNDLTQVPIPNFEYEDLVKSLAKPEAYFEHETFIPESDYGPLILSFPYSRVFIRYVTSERVRYFIRGWPSWRGFVSDGHPSRALEITAAIAKEFADTASERGQASLVLTYPTAASYDLFINSEEIAYQPLITEIAAAGVNVLDLHEPIRDYLDGRKICDLLTNVANCVGHFNPEGNEVVADAIYRKIVDEALLQPL